MHPIIDFEIQAANKISQAFLQSDIYTFHQAIDFIQSLKYGRNSNKEDLTTIFTDKQATCSTKHAILKQLAIENQYADLQLILGVFKMNATNTPKVAAILNQHQLKYIPEAHTYLKHQSQVYDYTLTTSSASDFQSDLIFEIEIQPHQINRFKTQLHRNFLEDWLMHKPEIKYSLDEIWLIREQCIANLSL